MPMGAVQFILELVKTGFELLGATGCGFVVMALQR